MVECVVCFILVYSLSYSGVCVCVRVICHGVGRVVCRVVGCIVRYSGVFRLYVVVVCLDCCIVVCLCIVYVGMYSLSCSGMYSLL